MHVQTLASGSQGNSTLVRAGDTHLLIDAGLPTDELLERLDAARVAPRSIDHIALTHGHLDHARAAGELSRRYRIPIHCAERLASNRSVRGAHCLSAFTIGRTFELAGARGDDGLRLRPVLIPHDARPTVAFRVEHGERVAALVTDMGRPDREAAVALRGAELLVLEFNHDADLLARGPYASRLKRRVGGPHGHLSNDQACEVLRAVASPALHTLVLGHLSRANNTPELARAAAERTLGELGRTDVQVLVAGQDEIGPNLKV
ncbi:MAG: MBL fold metallo-hydrolase [Planctomycetota bacterium]